MSNSQEVAKIILEQLGGHTFIAMTGAYNFLSSNDGRGALSFRFKGCRVANHLKITLTAMDDYTLEFTKIRGMDFKKVGGIEGVYCDTLAKTFRSFTGLETRL